MTDTATDTRGDVHIERVFNAPRQLVFDAFAKTEHLLQWFGPHSFPVESWTHDFRPGGTFEYVMRGPNGEAAPAAGEYVEIVEPERIVGLARLERDGVVAFEVRQTMTFIEEGDRTRFRLDHVVVYNDDFPGTSGAHQGWSESFDKLEAWLVTQQG